MSNTIEWWDNVKSNDRLFDDWLLRQYRGEVRASIEVGKLALRFEQGSSAREKIERVANDEARHASWVKAILVKRNIEPNEDQENSSNRYWKEVMIPEITLDEMMAVGAHAETMRLERIRVIMDDTEIDESISKTFRKIYNDEITHVEIFSDLASHEAMAKMAHHHDLGKKALGLEC